MKCFATEVNAKLKSEQSRFISETNVHSFNHGTHWQSHNSSDPDEVSTMQNVSNEIALEKSDIINYRIEALYELVDGLSESMSSAFMREMYSTVGRVSDANGQSVNAIGRSPVEGFIEMLEKIEFGVNRSGEPVTPDLHMHPDAFKAFKNDPKLNDPDIKARIELLTEKKKNEALERERLRLARFRKIDE